MSAKLFAEIGAAVGSVYRYFSPGDYVVTLGKVAIAETDDGPKFIVETTVNESTNATIKPGESISYVVHLFGPLKKKALAEVKTFVCRIGGIDADNTPEAQIGAAVAMVTGDKQKFNGTKVSLHVDTPKDGKKFCQHHWSAIE